MFRLGRHERSLFTWKKVGVGLIFFWALQTYGAVQKGQVDSIFWLCNIMTLGAAIAILSRSVLLVSAAFCATFLIHSIWVIDLAYYVFSQHFLFRAVASYVSTLDTLGLILTAHHIFLWPLLLTWLIRRRAFDWRGWLVASLLFALLIPVSRYFHGMNVNCSYIPCFVPITDALLIMKRYGYNGYPYALMLGTSFFIFFPAALLLQILAYVKAWDRFHLIPFLSNESH